MTYDYMTPTQFKAYTGLDDAGIARITPGDSMTLAAMISLNSNTRGRFNFEIHSSGLYAMCTWVNYYQTEAAGNYKIDNDTGAAVLDPQEKKDILITGA